MAKKILATPSELKPAPRRGIPLWLKLTAGALAGLLLLAMAAPFFIPWDKLKDKAVTQVSQSLGRPLSIGKVEVGLFSGVHVKDIRLANAPGAGFSAQPLFSNADAKVSVNFLSLLTGRVLINSISFDKPAVLLETNAQGVSNLQGLGGGAKAGEAKAAEPAAAGKGPNLNVIVAALALKQGDIIVRDKQKGTETAVHGLDVTLSGFSLAAGGDSRLEASLTAVVEGKSIPVKLIGDFSVDLGAEALTLRSFTLTLPALSAGLKGTVKGFKQPQVDLTLDAALALADLEKLLPPSALKSLPPELKTSGSVALGLHLQGPAKEPQRLAMSGSVELKAVNAAYGSYPAVADMNGRLAFDKAGAELPALALKLGGDPLTLGLKAHWGDLGNLSGGAAKLKADVQLSLKSPKLNLDPLLAAGSSGKAEPAKTAAPAPNGGISDYRGMLSKGLSVSLDVDVDAVSAQGFKTGKLVERLRLAGQKLSTSTDVDLYKGHLAERSAVDLSVPGPLFRTQAQMQGVDLGPFVDDLAAADPKDAKLALLKGKVTGILAFKADVHGKGLKDPAMTQGRAGKVSFQLANGVIRKTDLQEQLASAIPDPQTQAVLRGDIQFSNALGEVELAGPRSTLKSFSLGTGSDWRGGPLFLQANGTLVKDGPVDLRIVPHLNPRQVKLGGDVGKAFEDAQGWPTYDYVAYQGPTMAQAKADFSAGLKKAATKAVTDQVQRAVQEKAGDVLKQVPGLDKLFGR